MRIFITGATGLVGRALTRRLVARQHRITILSRTPGRARQLLPADVTPLDSLTSYDNFNQFDAVINLAGEPIFDQRWTVKQKARLTDSRIKITERLTALINRSDKPPHTFISGSAAGYYGDCGERTIDENTPPADSFPARLCRQWEEAALQAETRVCLLRTGIVLASAGGALARILPLYRCGLGGKLGGGRQYWAWIALEDMVDGILFLLDNPNCRGAFNLVSPNPVRNAEFNRILGTLLKRPHFAAVPAFLLKSILGERAGLLLDSQKILPAALSARGFEFQLPELKYALAAVLKS